MAKQRDPYESVRSYSSSGSRRSSGGRDPYAAVASYKAPKPTHEEKEAKEKADRRKKLEAQKKNQPKPKSLADLAGGVKDVAGKVGGFLFSGTEKVGDAAEALAGGFDRKVSSLDRQLKEKKIDRKTYQKKLKAIQEDIKWAGSKPSGTGERLKKAAGVTLETASELAPIPIGKAAKGASVARRAAKGAAGGAVAAGAGSAGAQLASEGKISVPKTLSDLAAGGILGGAVGAVTGSRKLRESINRLKEKIPSVHAADDVIQVKSMGSVGKAEARAGKRAAVKKALLDRNQPVSDLSTEVESILGRKLGRDENPAELMKLRGGVEGQAVTHLRDTAGWMKNIPRELREDGDQYGYAKQFLSQADKRTPEQIQTAQNTIAKLEQKYGGNLAPLEDYTQKTRETFDSLIDMYEGEGLISKQHANNLRKNPDYFAKMEVLQDETDRLFRGKTSSVNVREVRGLKGIKGQQNNAILAPSAESYVKQTTRAIDDVANNKVGRSLGKLADETGEGSPIMRLEKESTDIPKGYTRITYLEDGKKNFLAVPKEVGDVLTGADAQTFDLVTSAIGKVHNIFRQGVTTYNPLFVFLRNPARDIKSFLTNSRFVPVRRALFDYSTAMMDALTKGTWTKEFLRAGGGQAGYFSREGGQAGKQIAKTTKELTGKRSTLGRVVTSPRDFMQAMSEAIEMAPRVAEYRAARKKGKSAEEAAIAGREVTVDFAQGGNVAKVMNQWVPFLNARAQGVRRLGQALKENPKRALTVWAATGIAPMATLMAWNQSNFKDIWNDIQDYEKENNFIFITGRGKDGKPNYVKFPKGDIDKILGNTFETMLDQFMGSGKPAAQQLVGSLISGASNVSPISFASGGNVNAASVLSGALPPVAKVPAEAAANYSFFKDAPIVPENLQGAPTNEQLSPSTTGLAALIGNKAGLSPLQVDNAMQGLAGNVPADIYNAATRNPRTADRLTKGVVSATGGKIETEFWKTYSPAKKTKEYRERQFYKLIEEGKYKEAQRRADEYNRDIDKRFGEYFKVYGSFVPREFDSGVDPMEVIDSLKMDIVISKKGKPYIKR